MHTYRRHLDPHTGCWLRFRTGSLLLILLLAAMPLHAERFWGRVTGPNGATVAYPSIQIQDHGSVRGDSRGYFALNAVPLGELQLLIEAVGYFPLRQRVYQAREGARNFELKKLLRDDPAATLLDLLQQPSHEGGGLSSPGSALELDLNRDGLSDAWVATGGRRLELFQDGFPLSGFNLNNLSPLQAQSLKRPWARQWQDLGRDVFAFRHSLNASLSQSRPWNLGPSFSAEALKDPNWIPRHTQLRTGVGTRGDLNNRAILEFQPAFNQRLRLSLNQLRRVSDNGADNSEASLELEHRLPLSAMLLENRFFISSDRLEEPLAQEGDALLLDQADALLSGDRVEFASRALSLLANDLQLRFDLQLSHRSSNLRRNEKDLYFRRGLGSLADGNLTQAGWFDSERREIQNRQALSMHSRWTHDHGLFELSLWGEHQSRLREGSLLGSDASVFLPENQGNWYGLRDGLYGLALRMRDIYELKGPLALDVGFAARFSSYSFERLATRIFTSEQQVGFDDDLLSLEPQLGLIWTSTPKQSMSLYWTAGKRAFTADEYWDTLDPPTAPFSSPLFSSDGFGTAVPLLKTESMQQLRFSLEQQSQKGFMRFNLRHEKRDSPPGQWLKNSDRDPVIPLYSNGGLLTLLSAELETSQQLSPRTRFSGAVNLGWSRWLESWMIFPLDSSVPPGTSNGPLLPDRLSSGLYTGPASRYQRISIDGHESAYAPPLQTRLSLDQRAKVGSLPMQLQLTHHYRSTMQAEPSAAAVARIAAMHRLDLELSAELPLRKHDLQLKLFVDNLLKSRDPQWARVERIINENARRNEWLQSARRWRFELTLSW